MTNLSPSLSHLNFWTFLDDLDSVVIYSPLESKAHCDLLKMMFLIKKFSFLILQKGKFLQVISRFLQSQKMHESLFCKHARTDLRIYHKKLRVLCILVTMVC